MFQLNKRIVIKIHHSRFFLMMVCLICLLNGEVEASSPTFIPPQNSSGNPRYGQTKKQAEIPTEEESQQSKPVNTDLQSLLQPNVNPHTAKIRQNKPMFGPAVQESDMTMEKEDKEAEGIKIQKKPAVHRIEHLVLEKNMAEFVGFNEQVSEVFVANPEIVDVQVDGTSGGYVFARKLGCTTIIVRGIDGSVVSQINVRVTHNLNDLRGILKKTYPNEVVKVESTPTGLFLSGSVSSSVIAKEIESISRGFIVDKEKITNGMTISSPTQILLKVKIAEVNRTVLNQFGINWAAIGSPEHFMFGILMGRNPIANAFNQTIPAGTFVPGGTPITGQPPLNSYGFQYKDSHTNVSTLLDALDSEDLATILAEPNLMAVSGESASFLVGGEFPYPVPQNNSVSVEFKEYGIRLAFVPTVLDSNKISLRVGTEVSELDNVNKLTVVVYGGAATTVPAIKTRKAETTVELGDGQSLAMAGLLTNTMANHYDDIPGLGDVPILGTLFRSTSFQRDQTELVIIVTPISVKPTSDPHALMLPTDNLKRASNIEQLGLQRLNRPTIPAEKANQQVYGEAGFNVE